MKITLKCLAIGLMLPVMPVHASVMYSLVDLMPENPTINSSAYSINDSGHILGFTTAGDSFVYQNGSVNWPSIPRYASPAGINSNGVVVGNSAGRGFVYNNGVTQFLNGFSGSPYSTKAAGINDAGQIVGSAWNTQGNQRAIIANNGSLTDLGTLGGVWSQGNAINNSGQVTGEAQTSYGGHAFITRNGEMVDLGAFAWGVSRGWAINDIGQVAGTSLINSIEKHAFITTVDDRMIDIGLSGYSSEAFGINNAGQAVGYFEDVNNPGSKRAFVTLNGVMTDLNTLIAANIGWTLMEAYDVNNSGQIVGLGIAENGLQRAFLLNPVASVPLPASFWLFGSVLLGLGRQRIRSLPRQR